MNKFTKFFMAGAFAAFGALAANAEMALTMPERVDATAGQEITIPVDMINSDPVCSIAFWIELPKDFVIPVETVWDEDEEEDVEVPGIAYAGNREKPTHTISYNNEFEDGHWQTAWWSTKNATFKGNDGQVIAITVNVPETAVAGEYPVTLSHVKLTCPVEGDTKDYKDVDCADVTCKIVIAAAEIQNAEAFDADNATINALTEKVVGMIDGVAERLPNFASEDEADVVRQMIDDLGEEVDDAWEEAETTRVYVSPVTVEKIDAIEKAAADYVAAVEARATEAYDKAMQDAADDGFALQTLLDDLDEIPGGDLAGYYDEEEYDDLYMEVQMALDQQQVAFQAAAAGYVPEYVSPFAEGEIKALQNKVAAFVDAAQTAKEEAEAAIQEAYEADLAAYNALDDKVQDTRANIEAKYAAFIQEGDADAVLDALNDLYDDIDDAKDAAETTHVYVPQVTEEAKDKVLKALDDFCAAVVARFDAAFDAAAAMAKPDYEKLNALKKNVQDIAGEYEKYDEETYEELLGEIAALQSQVSAAVMDAAINNTEYVSPVTEEVVAALGKKIADFEEAAKLSGIYGIGVDAKGTHYFDMQGVRVANPAPGKMYIRVVDGKATKVIVK